MTRVSILQSSRLVEKAKVPARKYFVLCNTRPNRVTVKVSSTWENEQETLIGSATELRLLDKEFRFYSTCLRS